MTFKLSTFVKLMGAEALREHLHFRGVDLAEQIGTGAEAAALARFVREKWPGLSAADLEQLGQDFDRAEQFVGEDAQAVLRTSCLRSVAALAEIEGWTSDRARSLAILRLAPAIFEDAENQLDVSSLLRNRQLSAGYQVTGNGKPHWSEVREDLFKERVRDVFRKHDGVPRRLHVRHDFRHRTGADGGPIEPISQFTVFHEGDANREPAFGDDGEITVVERRRALMAVVSHDPALGTLDVAASGGRNVKQAIVDSFVAAFWPEPPALTKLQPATFALLRLRRPMTFDFRRSDGLRSVALTSVTLVARGEGRLDQTMRLPRRERNGTFWNLVQRQYGVNNPLGDPGMEIVSAEIRFEFDPGPGEKTSKNRTVKLSLANGSNKGRLTERQQRIVEIYLREWQLLDAF